MSGKIIKFQKVVIDYVDNGVSAKTAILENLNQALEAINAGQRQAAREIINYMIGVIESCDDTEEATK